MQEEWSRTAVRRRVNAELEKARFAERTRRARLSEFYAFAPAVASEKEPSTFEAYWELALETLDLFAAA